MRHLLRLLNATWTYVVRPAPMRFIVAAVLGVGLRCLAVLCFVLTIQALLLAALPDRGGFLSNAEEVLLTWAGVSAANPALLAAVVVVAAFSIQLVLQYIYNWFLGGVIGTTTESLLDANVGTRIPEARRIAKLIATQSVKCTEIGVFLVAACLSLYFFDTLILAGMVIGGAVALIVFVFTRKSGPNSRLQLDAMRYSIGSERDSTATEFLEKDERFRFKRSVESGMDGFVLGALTAFLVVLFVIADIELGPEKSAYAVILVFSLRYAIVYVRELGRSVSSLLDLRVERLLK